MTLTLEMGMLRKSAVHRTPSVISAHSFDRSGQNSRRWSGIEMSTEGFSTGLFAKPAFAHRIATSLVPFFGAPVSRFASRAQ